QMTSYNEYCPIAVGAELLGDRWTPLVLRELIIGSRRFNEIHRGVPRMNRTLLTQRLRSLERRGVIERVEIDGGAEYRLTEAGKELEPIIWSLGQWAAQWAFGDPEDTQLDAALLVWRLHQFVALSKLPADRVVIEFVLTGVGGRRVWLVLDRGEATACVVDPGYDVDLVVDADSRAMHRWLLGRAEFKDLQRSGDARLIGPTKLVRAFPTWFALSPFAADVAAAAS
ncbi:MAG TPA: helix-turn-helix domain-containing protein, partial [Microthrixaceae bacterium]|nr:helix-turn-helix domain-containing protein [Microthrixaceae bacterium]